MTYRGTQWYHRGRGGSAWHLIGQGLGTAIYYSIKCVWETMIQHLFILLKWVDFFHACGDMCRKVGYCGTFRDTATVWLRVELYYYSLCMSLWQSRIHRVHRSGIYTLSCLRGTYRGSEIYVRRTDCNTRRVFRSPNILDQRSIWYLLVFIEMSVFWRAFRRLKYCGEQRRCLWLERDQVNENREA